MPASWDKADYRRAALLCAVRTCATSVTDLLALHPEVQALRQQLTSMPECSLGQLLWRELTDGEKRRLRDRGQGLEPAGRRAVEYWQRRRRLAEWQRWQRTAEALPGAWVRLLEMPAAEARDLCVSLGSYMLAIAARGQSSAKLVAWLGPLGGDTALAVMERIRHRPPRNVPSSVAARWRDAYARSARALAGDRILSALGRSLLASLYRRLPEDQRRTAGQTSRTSLPSLLENDAFLEPVGEEELKWAQALLEDMVSARKNEPKAEPEPPGRWGAMGTE